MVNDITRNIHNLDIYNNNRRICIFIIPHSIEIIEVDPRPVLLENCED